MAARHFELSDTGKVRSNNQDRVLSDEGLGLWVVADGMGGHAGGAEASRLAAEAVQESIAHGMPLEDAFEVAHSRVRSAQDGDPALSDMGTTLVALHEEDSGYHVAWVGDSRLYRFNARTGTFECMTRDHNIAGRLLDTGRITEAQARSHPQRHVLTDCIGQREGLPTIESCHVRWRRGDRLVLCSDGLNSELSDDQMAGALRRFDSPREVAEKLTEMALAAGGRDNISLIVLDAP